MAVNKGRTAQRKRRAREALEKQEEPTLKKKAKPVKPPRPKKTAKPTTPSTSNKNGTLLKPIPINDCGENRNAPILVEDDEISDLQREEIEQRNQANDVVQLLSTLYYDIDSDLDEVEDEDEDEIRNEDILQSLWPLFYSKKDSTSVSTRSLASGGTGYQKPIKNPDLSSKKLIPRPLPSSTKCDYKKNFKKAVGKNNNIMINWLIKTTPENSIPSDSNENEHDDILPSCDRAQAHISSEALECRLAEQLDRYLSSPNKLSSINKITISANKKWAELNLAIIMATATCQDQLKKNPKFRYPKGTIEDLHQFNTLRRQYTISGVKKPSLTASLETAISAIRRAPPPDPNKPPIPRSGIYHARQISQHAGYVMKFKQIKNSKNGNRTNHKSILDDVELRRELFQWASNQTIGAVTPNSFRTHVLNHTFPAFKIEKTISRQTATAWMYKLGFSPQEYKKSIYFDGHERDDVVESRKLYIQRYRELRRLSRIYGTDNLEMATPVDPEVLGDNRETVFIYHDESTVHTKERPGVAWLLPGTSEIRSKNSGRLIHISDFILETTGRLTSLATDNTPSIDAATIIYPGSTGDKWWDMQQLCNQVTEKAIPIFNQTHPTSQAVFVFDCSSAHGAYSPSALRVQSMNLKFGGKQARLRDSIIPFDDPHIPIHLHGQVQKFVYENDHPDPDRAGKPKGVRVILEERGLWQHYTQKARESGQPAFKFKCTTCTTSGFRKDAAERSARLIRQAEANGFFLSEEQCIQELMQAEGTLDPVNPVSPETDHNECSTTTPCCWFRVMQLQSDFQNERPLLQTIIEDAGHICLFLPKFHCELNPIELFWLYIKQAYRQETHTCKAFSDYKALFDRIRKSCPLSTIRKYFRRIDRQISAYEQGYNGPQSAILMKKYTSHRCIPRRAAMQIDMLTS
ncbi:uncharacterized protein PGTG_06383 [Puccinia graminis f. sp. tritici CRL 75-36-700-3]|uniref:Tc1-like transposase DDE domain-containing protein n=1 Tax=Puccinia graminis f. sp. tritici (strain CRL 75-36-700-3 / race SCCL) TaxID=418459 RepID=E3K841_PUCGT|nr:uncharacterized protein PGTG_06383 [Puccinia graminis f. sp. tritici CRL 75-36-700-3]EFP80427.2 hypothetical protein PGTG_06383 [Puccinia graminis f. sp. tritici CRL 75-36-700-3]